MPEKATWHGYWTNVAYRSIERPGEITLCVELERDPTRDVKIMLGPADATKLINVLTRLTEGDINGVPG